MGGKEERVAQWSQDLLSREEKEEEEEEGEDGVKGLQNFSIQREERMVLLTWGG